MVSELQTLPKEYENWHPKEEDTSEKIVIESSPLKEQKESQEKKEIVDFSKCQIEEVIKAYINNLKVEWESLSPYLSDYNTATGEIFKDKDNKYKLTNSDAIGLAIGKKLREIFKDARIISLYDEYNSGMPDSSDPRGMPTWEGKQIEFDEETKQNFRQDVKDCFEENGIIRKGDKEGKDYLLVSESSKIEQAQKLTELLEQKELVRKGKGEEIWFDNGEESFLLKTSGGRWLCEALDASAFLDPHNLETTHLVILPEYFKQQQDRVWVILRSLGFQSKNYHNIYYQADANPEEVANKIADEIISKWMQIDPKTCPRSSP